MPAFSFPTSGRDAQKKMFMGYALSKVNAGDTITKGPAQFNCSRDFATGQLVDFADEMRCKIFLHDEEIVKAS